MLQVQLELVASIAWAAQSVQCVHIPCTKTEMMMVLVLSRSSRDRSAPYYHWSRVTLWSAGLCHTLPELSWNRLLWIILHCTDYLLSSPHSLTFFIQFWTSNYDTWIMFPFQFIQYLVIRYIIQMISSQLTTLNLGLYLSISIYTIYIFPFQLKCAGMVAVLQSCSSRKCVD